jgi:hypothetical protein
MIEAHRRAVWGRICQYVDGLDDGTGKRVDPGIHRLVVALRAHGCPTFASCEGHDRWGFAQPSVDIRLPGAMRVGQENDRSYRVVWPLERRTALALVRLLNAFYENRLSPPHHARLVVHRLRSPGWLRVSTAAYDAGFELRDQERRVWLRQGQHEARSFASFLEEGFLRNGPMVGPEPILA